MVGGYVAGVGGRLLAASRKPQAASRKLEAVRVGEGVGVGRLAKDNGFQFQELSPSLGLLPASSFQLPAGVAWLVACGLKLAAAFIAGIKKGDPSLPEPRSPQIHPLVI